MAEFSLQALHDEIEADPEAIGYKEAGGAWKADSVIADLINDPENGDTIMRKLIAPSEIWTSIPFAEYELYSAAKQQWLDTALELVGGEGVIDANDSVVYNNLLAMFPGGSEARANILAKIQRQGSRAEVLWGEDKVVTVLEVAYAANL